MEYLLDDDSLIRAAQRGDVRAYATLVARYRPAAQRTAALIAGAADAGDATQAAFIKAYAALERFRLGAPFRPWLLRIVVNEACSVRRLGLRQRRVAERVVEQPRASIEPSPEEMLIVREESRMLAHALASLTPKHRDVVTCRLLLELSEEETSAALAIPCGTVKSRLSRALDNLRVELEGPARAA